MQPVREFVGTVAVLMRSDIDADTIIPNRFCITTRREGLARGLFHAWAAESPDFVLNRLRPAVLVTGPNFGCGSSREHAVWALLESGVRAVVAASFGQLFQGNALRNGLVTIQLDPSSIQTLADRIGNGESTARVSVETQQLDVDGLSFPFTLPPMRRQALLKGLDDIGMTMMRQADIDAFTAADRERRPWAWL